MLRMANKIILFLSISTLLLAGSQNVHINLNLTYPGASQKIIGEKMVIDLGYLKEGQSYNNIEIGSVDVKITQIKTAEDDNSCVLKNLEFDAVNKNNLQNFSETIEGKDKVYIGKIKNKINLMAKEVTITSMEGDIDGISEELYFVDPECIGDPLFSGDALVSLTYSFKLFATIDGEIQRESIVGAFAQDSTGIETSIKRLIERQIRDSIITKRRRNR